MRRRLIILAIVIFILLIIFIFTGSSQLSSKETQVNKRFSAMVPELSIRYEKTKEALAIAKQVGGKRDLTDDGEKSIREYRESVKDKNVKGQLSHARELENIIGRLRSHADSSPKLFESEALDNAINEIDEAYPAQNVRESYENSVKKYENTRTSWRYLASAFFGGHSAPTQLRFSLPEEQES